MGALYVLADSQSSLVDAINRSIRRDMGQSGYGQQVLWTQYDGANPARNGTAATTGGYTHIVRNTATGGLHAAYVLSATTAAAALTPTTANSVVLIKDDGILVGAGKSLALYNVAGTFAISMNGAAATANRTVTFPDAAGTVALLERTQTFTGQNSFTEATAPIITAKIGPSSTQQHALPAVTSDTVALLAATQTFSGTNTLSSAAPLIFTGTGARVTGDFSNATRSSRLMFQSSLNTSDTLFGIIPNNTATISKFEAYNSSSPDIASVIATMESNATEMRLTSITSGGAAAPLLMYTGTTKAIDIATNGSVNHPLTTYINDTSNANMSLGLTINQGAADDEILALKSSDVAHGMTSLTETDTYGVIRKLTAATGGVLLAGYDGTATIGVGIAGRVGAATATRSTSGLAPILFTAQLKSGTSAGSVGGDQNIVAFRDSGTTRFILDSDGDSHQDVGTAWTNFDDYDDIGLLTALSVGVSRQGDPVREQFGYMLNEHQYALSEARIVAFNPDGHHFVNMSRLTMLLVGAVRQLGTEVTTLRQGLRALTTGG